MPREALAHVDLLVVLPLTAADAIDAGADEHLPLRDRMNDVLLDLIADADLLGDRLTVVEISGAPAHRVSALESQLSQLNG